MIRKLLFITAFLTVNITGLMSCLPGTCHRGIEPNTYCINYTVMEVNAFDALNVEQYERSPSENTKVLEEANSVSYNRLLLEFGVIYDERNCYRAKPSLFGNTAYACSLIDYYIIDDSITSVEVYSDNDFDDEHKAGTNIRGYFSDLSVEELNLTSKYAHNYLELNVPPSISSLHSFTIIFKKASGAELTATTVPIKVLK